MRVTHHRSRQNAPYTRHMRERRVQHRSTRRSVLQLLLEQRPESRDQAAEHYLIGACKVLRPALCCVQSLTARLLVLLFRLRVQSPLHAVSATFDSDYRYFCCMMRCPGRRAQGSWVHGYVRWAEKPNL